LERRIAELERRAIRYRNTLVLLVVGVCAVVVVGATTDDGVIRGRALVLKNDQGEMVVWAGASTSGNGLLKVTSKTGTDLIYAGASTEGDGLLKVISKTGTDLIYAGGSTEGHGLLTVSSETGTDLIYAGADIDGDGLLKVKSKTGTDLIYAGASTDGNGFFFEGFNKTGEGVVQLSADDYGNGVVGAYNRKGKGRTLKSR
jgi:hypothetical protein